MYEVVVWDIETQEFLPYEGLFFRNIKHAWKRASILNKRGNQFGYAFIIREA